MNLWGRAPQGELNGFLDSGSHLEGDLTFEQTFRVDGKLTGKVVSDGDLIIGEKGEVEGEIRVGRVFVNGLVRGQIHARRRLEIGAHGRVFGELATPALVVEEGATIEGRCAMAPAEPAAAVPLPKVARLPTSGRDR